jgi:hypothetical protein
MDDRTIAQLNDADWEHLFDVLHELGLREHPPQRAQAYREQYGEFFSTGNFWALVQSLERQTNYRPKPRRQAAEE